MLKEDLHLGWFDHGQFHISKRPLLASLRKDCEHEIQKIDKAERDRKLNNRGIRVAIWCGIGGLFISIISLLWTIRTDNRLDELDNRMTRLEQALLQGQ